MSIPIFKKTFVIVLAVIVSGVILLFISMPDRSVTSSRGVASESVHEESRGIGEDAIGLLKENLENHGDQEKEENLKSEIIPDDQHISNNVFGRHMLNCPEVIKSDATEYFVCPCCGWCGYHYDVGEFAGRKALCPNEHCSSVERHRGICALMGTHSINDGIIPFAEENKTPFRVAHWGPDMTVYNSIIELSSELGNILDQVSLEYDKKFLDDRNINGYVADVMNIPFPDGFFNGHILIHVLEHVPNIQQAFSEISRTLVPGGWVILEIPCRLLPDFPAEEEEPIIDCRNMSPEVAAYVAENKLNQKFCYPLHLYEYECEYFWKLAKRYGGLECLPFDEYIPRYNTENKWLDQFREQRLLMRLCWKPEMTTT